MRASAPATFLVGLCGACSAQKVQLNPTDKNELLGSLAQTPQSDQERADRIQALFAAGGCTGNLLRAQPVEGASGPNVICELHGHDKESIVVGAHYDQAVTAGPPTGNWIAASRLPALYHGLRNRKRRHTFVLVAFADHGGGVARADFLLTHMR